MKNKKMLLALMLLGANLLPTVVSANENVVATEKKVIYNYVDKDGQKLKNSWISSDNNWKFLNEEGNFVKNSWKYIKGEYYYFDENENLLRDTITPDGYTVDNTGKWIKDIEKDKNNILEIQSYDEDYFLLKTFKKEDGKYVYYENDKKVTGWKKIGKHNYHFEEDGSLSRNKWVDDYYLNNYGKIKLLSWIKKDNDFYYLDGMGKIVKNTWKNINGNNYHFEEDGKLSVNKWIDDTYYVGEQGVLFVNSKTPDGEKVNEKGQKIKQETNKPENNVDKEKENNIVGENNKEEKTEQDRKISDKYQNIKTKEKIKIQNIKEITKEKLKQITNIKEDFKFEIKKDKIEFLFEDNSKIELKIEDLFEIVKQEYPVEQMNKTEENNNSISSNVLGIIEKMVNNAKQVATAKGNKISTPGKDGSQDVWDSYKNAKADAMKKATNKEYAKYLYSSCDRWVATMLISNEVDKDYPWGAVANQYNYLKNSPKWEKVSCEDRKAGDVFVLHKNNRLNSNHTGIYMGNDLVTEASYYDYLPTTNKFFGCSGDWFGRQVEFFRRVK